MAALWLVLCGPAAGDAPAAPLSPPPAVLRAAGDAPAVHPAAAAPAPPRAPIKKTPIPQGDAYRFDAEYQKLQRYDFLPYLLSREKRRPIKNGRGLDHALQVHDRALVLAGKGFRNPGTALDPVRHWPVNPYFHVKEDTPPIPLPPRQDALDPSLEGVTHHRPLVFHSSVSGFYDVPLNLPPIEANQEPEPPSPPPAVPETRVLLSGGSKTLLRLEPSARRWDLLRDPLPPRGDRRNRWPRTVESQGPLGGLTQ